MTYATVNDVATLLARALTDAETTKATALLPVADAKINRAVPSIASRIGTESGLNVLVTHVAASLVARALSGAGDGVTAVEESIDDYRKVERRETASEDGGFELTAGEIDLLRPADTAAAGAFTIKPYSTARIPQQRRPVDCP